VRLPKEEHVLDGLVFLLAAMVGVLLYLKLAELLP